MWRSLSFMLYVGSISALDFPQIGFCFALAPKGPAGGGWGRERCAVARNRCSGLLGAACALEIAARTCSGAHTPRMPCLVIALAHARRVAKAMTS